MRLSDTKKGGRNRMEKRGSDKRNKFNKRKK